MTGLVRRTRIRFLAAVLTLAAAPLAAAGEGPTLRLEVDARDLPRRLMHARIEVPCKPGKLALWYPKWVPGTHSPCGPIEDMAGLRVETPDGKAIPWKRDQVELCRVECDVPAGTAAVIVRLDVICNRPSEDAAGYLTYGTPGVGIINWATCLMYPEGPSSDDTRVDATLRLPPSWDFACALEADPPPRDAGDGPSGRAPIHFRPTSLTRFVDNPLIGGTHVRHIRLETGPFPPAFLDVASASPIEIAPNVVSVYSRVVQQAGALFGTCHYPSFHILVTCSDELGYMGLEHLECSVNGVRDDDLRDGRSLGGWVGNLVPHEYVHSWCGKFRRPAGMCTPNFHVPQRTALLWVYEGLTEYLGEILMARSGMINPAEYRRMLTGTIESLSHQEGRRWRSLEDTAIASPLLRASSPNWNELRRSQDYYFEGALIWLEADAIIRQKTGGKRSLDDFCRKFLGMGPTDAHVVPYELADVVKVLREVCDDFDWEKFLRDRTEKPQEVLPLDVLGRLGYRVNFNRRTPGFGGRISRGGGDGPASARESIGLSFDAEGRVTDVVPGMPGDRAGFGPGMKVFAVNRKVFKPAHLHEALVASIQRKKIEFMLEEGDELREVVIPYADGPKYLELARNSDRPDLLAQILKPLPKPAQKP